MVGACKHIIAVAMRVLLSLRRSHGNAVRVLQRHGAYSRENVGFSQRCGSERLRSCMCLGEKFTLSQCVVAHFVQDRNEHTRFDVAKSTNAFQLHLHRSLTRHLSGQFDQPHNLIVIQPAHYQTSNSLDIAALFVINMPLSPSASCPLIFVLGS